MFDDKNYIAMKIKQFRNKKLLTQEKLAESIGITAKQLSRIENGDYTPSLSTFLKIIKELDINIEEFGLNIAQNSNPTREKLLMFVYGLNDKEIEFYYNIVENIKNNIKLVK